MKVAILYVRFFDHNGYERMIGGVETYLLNLAKLCQDMGMQTIIYQWSNLPFEKSVDGLRVKGVPVCSLPYRKIRGAFYRTVVGEIDESRDILVFGADRVSVPTQNPLHISIQHGVSWDLPAQHLTCRKIVKHEWAARLIKWRMARLARKSFENCPNTVCVDYNFLNWYRTTVTREPDGHRIWVVPNFAPVASDGQVKARTYENRDIRILFARRFVQYRGTRLVAEVARRLLDKYPEITFTFAGQGPEESWLRKQLASEDRVRFIKYVPDETLRIHLEYDIAVVPSLASEGTCLSVAEAMATGCPVVATATGGVTNMIINGYNGILVMPNVASLQEGLESLILDSVFRRRIGVRGYETAKEAFSIARWQRSWQNILEQIAGEHS